MQRTDMAIYLSKRSRPAGALNASEFPTDSDDTVLVGYLVHSWRTGHLKSGVSIVIQ